MTRKLLPYEHQMIEALGVTKEEYLDFLSAQRDYALSVDQKLATPQADFVAVSLVLTIVGALFQVAGALLAPKPKAPEQKGQGAAPRQQRFAPRFGFNNVQELGRYGDPVNLVYCNANTNPTGGVRVGTSLIWSAVYSEGSSQYMQTLMLIGAGKIGSVDFSRSAFGQTPIREFVAQKSWTYYKSTQDGSTANVRFSDIVFPSGDTTDPIRTGSSDLVYRVDRGGLVTEGFSQAFSPSTLTTCGVYAPIPINTYTEERDTDGDVTRVPIGITIDDATFLSTYWSNTRPLIPEGTLLSLRFAKAASGNVSAPVLAAEEERFNYLSRIDAASTYKLGSAKFRLAAPLLNNDLAGNDAVVSLKCIETGVCPVAEYTAVTLYGTLTTAENERAALQARNATINTILLNPPPIYDPLVFDGVNNQLNAIQTTRESLEELLDAVVYFQRPRVNPFGQIPGQDPAVASGVRRLYLDTLIDESLVDPRVASIARSIKSLQTRVIAIPSGNVVESMRIQLQINQLQSQLNSAIQNYGLREGYVVSPITGLTVKGSDEITTIRNLLNANDRAAYDGILNAIGATGGGRNLEAEIIRNAELEAEKNSNTDRIEELDEIIRRGVKNTADFFATKCLVKVEEASYQVITDCRIVRFSLKARVFQRIGGRQRVYGEEKEKNYSLGDNGNKVRTALFWMWYRSSSSVPYQRVSYVFAIRRRADNDNFIDLNFIAPVNGIKWEFKFEPIAESIAELTKNSLPGNYSFAYIENNGPYAFIQSEGGVIISFKGAIYDGIGGLPPLEASPVGVSEWGLFSGRSDTQISYSFDNGPEITIAAVTEQREESLGGYPGLYKNLSLIGFNAYSGQGVQDLRAFTVFVKEGKLVRRLNEATGTLGAAYDTPSNYAPEIFLDTALNTEDGIGQYTKISAIDLERLALAKRFCIQNNLFFDGVIAEPQSWRSFWAENSLYSLLEMARIGGRETLVPALPVDTTGKILYTEPISVVALFNAGNILEGSYKEDFVDYGTDAQDLIANIIYRYTERDETFPRNRSVEVRRSDVTDLSGIRQTFDISDYVTNKSQAILFGKMLCQQRRHIKKTVEFKTFPTDTPLYPGAYIYVDIGNNSWEGIYSGKVEANGQLNVPLVQNINGTFNVLLYKMGVSPITITASIANNISSALIPYEGYLFVLGTPVKTKRTFRVVSVEMDEESEVTVTASEHPTDASGRSLISGVADASGTIIESITATSSTLFQVLE